MKKALTGTVGRDVIIMQMKFSFHRFCFVLKNNILSVSKILRFCIKCGTFILLLVRWEGGTYE